MTAINNHPINYFPTNENDVNSLRQRAEQLAAPPLEKIKTTELANYIQFSLGPTGKYGIDYNYAKEIINNANITKAPCAPEFVAGIINRRGALIAILDLKRVLFNQTTEYQADVNIIIVTANHITLGILTNGIDGNHHYDPTNLDTPIPSENITKTEFIVGIHAGEIAMINVDAVIAETLTGTRQ
jgi:purine-binding chemotaxis protein CheW